MIRSVDWSVYVITDREVAGGRPILDVVEAAIRGGATVVQLRDKAATTREMVELGKVLHALTAARGVPLVVNDRVDVALAIGAEGVHLGVDDMPVALARQILGPAGIIGASPDTIEGARQAEQDGADYLGVGDVYGTPTKGDAGHPIGLEGLGRMVRAVSIPVVAIGGIRPDNAGAAIEAGAAGVAVIAAVMGAQDPAVAVRRLRTAVRAAQVT